MSHILCQKPLWPLSLFFLCKCFFCFFLPLNTTWLTAYLSQNRYSACRPIREPNTEMCPQNVTSSHWKCVERELWREVNSSIALQFMVCVQCVKGKNVVWTHCRRKFENPEVALRLSGEEVCRVQLRHCHMTQRCVTTAVKAPGWQINRWHQRLCRLTLYSVIFHDRISWMLLLLFFFIIISYFWGKIKLVYCL